LLELVVDAGTTTAFVVEVVGVVAGDGLVTVSVRVFVGAVSVLVSVLVLVGAVSVVVSVTVVVRAGSVTVVVLPPAVPVRVAVAPLLEATSAPAAAPITAANASLPIASVSEQAPRTASPA
jgi:hypothetical protein